ncbi:MAG TPA: spore coat protein CotJB [Clostridia bacterium]|nr:spore coat protein CotJB [Clostridia bacterium]
MSQREKMMKKLSAAQFALFEIHLYLDTHPDDLQMLSLHRKYQSKYMLIKKEFEEKYGPLTPANGQGVEWLKDPWPWDLERERCDC